MIDVRDTGAVGARILIDPAPHAGKTYEFTGKLVTYPQFAEVFSEVLGKKVSYVPVTLEQNEQAVRARGLPDWLVTHLLLVARATATGGFSTENTKLIRDLVKREPITTRQFVEDFKGRLLDHPAPRSGGGKSNQTARPGLVLRHHRPVVLAFAVGDGADQPVAPDIAADGSGTPSASPAASARLASFNPLTARWPAGRYCSSTMNLP